MSNSNEPINIEDINNKLKQVEEAYSTGSIDNIQYSNIIRLFNDVLQLVTRNTSNSTTIRNNNTTPTIELSGGFLKQLISGGSSEIEDDNNSISTLNYNEEDSITQSISLKGGYDYMYNNTKKNKFTPTASYHNKSSITTNNTAANTQISKDSESLTGGQLNNYFNKLIESTLKNKKVKGGENEIDGGAKKCKSCKKKKNMKGGEDDNMDEEDSDKELDNDGIDEENDDNTDEKDDKKKDDDNIDEKDDKKKDDDKTEEKDDSFLNNDNDETDEEEDDEDDFILGGKSQLQPYHDQIVENINKYLDKYETDLAGEDKIVKGKQIKRLLNVLYYKSDENTSMEDRIKQLEDIIDKTNTEAKLKKIITGNKSELDSIIDNWVKAEPKKKNKKNKKNKKKKSKVFDESIEIQNNKKKSDTTETSIDGGIVETASMIDSVIMGGKKPLKRNLFNY